jgi:hypothetical protein
VSRRRPNPRAEILGRARWVLFVFGLFALTFFVTGLIARNWHEVRIGLLLGAVLFFADRFFFGAGGAPGWFRRIVKTLPPVTRWLFPACLLTGYVAVILLDMGIGMLVKQHRFDRDGVTVSGTVIRITEKMLSSSGKSSFLFTSPRNSIHIVDYQYRTREERTLSGSSSVTPRGLKLIHDGQVPVRYLPARPEESQIESEGPAGFFFTLMGTLFIAFAIGPIVIGVSQIRAAVALEFGGVETDATVTDVSDSNETVGSETYLQVRVRYVDREGRERSAVSPALPPAQARRHAVGSQVRIRYQAGDPDTIRWPA